MIIRSVHKARVAVLILTMLALMMAGLALPASASGGTTIGLPGGTVQATAYYPQTGSYFGTTLTFSGTGYDVTSGTRYLGWCIEENVSLAFHGRYPNMYTDPFNVALYSSLSPSLPPSVTMKDGTPIPWNKVNYVLNHKQGTWPSIQLAIWRLAWDTNTATGSMTQEQIDIAQAMVDEANANAGFVPDVGETVAVILDTTGLNGTTPVQKTIIEVTVPGTPAPHITLTKTAAPQLSNPVKVGDSINYQLIATNDGNVTLTNVVISDPTLGALTCSPQPTNLPPGSALTCSGSYKLTQADIDAAKVDNTATVTSTLRNGGTGPTDTDTVSTPVPTAALGDFVWLDLNGNGLQDAGEPGLPNVKVNLYLSGSSAILVSTTTDTNGKYLFTNLLTGSYYVQFVAPTGYVFTRQYAGTNTSVDSNANSTTAKTADVTLVAGPSDLTIDAGLVPPSLTAGDTATIGFWHNKNGQALIKSLNGGPTSTQLATWLATSFPYLYGAHAGANNLTGKTNADVAALFMKFFSVKGQKTDAQILGGALATYVSNSGLAGTVASKYGFNVTTFGTGFKPYNVGTHGSVIGLTNNTWYTVLQLLQAANLQTKLGTFNAIAFNTIFDGINQGGDIP